jgi:hypothetical protein
MILLRSILQEISDTQITKILSNVFHDMPEYIFKDFIMSKDGFFKKELQRIKRDDPGADEDDIAFEFEDWIDIKWKEQVIDVNVSDFTNGNQKTMKDRKFGNSHKIEIPGDKGRNEYQQDQAKKKLQGENEAVIVLSKGNEYRLLEGWHRTMAILSLGNNGEKNPTKWDKIKLNAWVGTGSSVKRVW